MLALDASISRRLTRYWCQAPVWLLSD